jgi:type IX secretion system PorP/SprF family membrane protein
MKKLLFIILAYCCSYSYAQQPLYTLYYTNPLPVNPAFTGSSHKFRSGINFRNQWSSFSSSLTAYSVYVDNYFTSINSGIGLNIYTDQAGNANYRTTLISASYAYNTRISNNVFLKAGIQPTLGFAGLDAGSLTYNDQLTATGSTGQASAEASSMGNNHTYINLNSGLLLTAQNFWLGISGYNLNSPKVGISDASKLPIGFGVQTGYKLEFLANQISRKEKKERFLMPHIFFSTIGASKQLYVGTEIVYEPFTAGITLRGNYFSQIATVGNSNSMAISIGFRKKNVQSNYCYDIPLSSKTSILGPSHEISIRTLFKLWQKPSRRKTERLDLF